GAHFAVTAWYDAVAYKVTGQDFAGYLSKLDGPRWDALSGIRGIVRGASDRARDYTPAAVAVITKPYPGGASSQAPAWPLAALEGFGGPTSPLHCGVLTGKDATDVMTTVGARLLTGWSSGSTDYSVVTRPLAPGEQTCQEALAE